MPFWILKIAYLGGPVTPRFLIYYLLLFAIVFKGTSGYKKLDAAYKLIYWLVVVVIISEGWGRYLSYTVKSSTLDYHFFAPLQCLFYAGIYYYLLPLQRPHKLIVLWLGIVSCGFAICNSLFIQPVNLFPSYSILGLCLYVVYCTMLGLSTMIKSPLNLPLTMQASFWFNLGNLFFYCLTFFVFNLFNTFLKSTGLPDWAFDIIWITNLVMYVCYYLALHMNISSKKAIE